MQSTRTLAEAEEDQNRIRDIAGTYAAIDNATEMKNTIEHVLSEPGRDIFDLLEKDSEPYMNGYGSVFRDERAQALLDSLEAIPQPRLNMSNADDEKYLDTDFPKELQDFYDKLQADAPTVFGYVKKAMGDLLEIDLYAKALPEDTKENLQRIRPVLRLPPMTAIFSESSKKEILKYVKDGVIDESQKRENPPEPQPEVKDPMPPNASQAPAPAPPQQAASTPTAPPDESFGVNDYNGGGDGDRTEGLSGL